MMATFWAGWCGGTWYEVAEAFGASASGFLNYLISGGPLFVARLVGIMFGPLIGACLITAIHWPWERKR